MPSHTAAAANQKPVNIAQQGGGAHGAFAWGVLDKLLEDGRLSIEAISATSAGTMNAVVLAYGVSIGGVDGAREKLAEFWKAISAAGELYSPVRTTPWEKWLKASGIQPETSPMFQMFQAMTHLYSPYQLNPFNFNPLRDVLVKTVDFERLSKCPKATRLYVSATNVRTGKIKVFENSDMSPDVVLASACLPYVFQAIEIDGETYWDGGYMGNPAIYPLIYNGRSKDVIVVHINPLERKKLPLTASEIFNRMNEISFNSSLMREMRAIAFVTKLIDEKALDDTKYKRINVHSIRDDHEMEALGVATKLNPEWDFLVRLHKAGRRNAGEWLDQNFDAVGNKSSIDIGETFL